MSNFYKKYGKRIFDLIVALISIVIFSPLMIIVSVLIALFMRTPVIFSQKRAGLNGSHFHIYKFRSMTDLYDDKGKLKDDDQRITLLGKYIRKASLDELPGLFNVLKNDMSLVGPRPLLIRYLERYSPEQARRHRVKPGLTGWAQVNGRNAISWDEKFKLDIWYVDNYSFWLDLKIIFLTFLRVFRGDGISSEGHSTMPEFKGNNLSSLSPPDFIKAKKVK